MAISDSQKVDYLWKKIGYSATKSDNVKAGFEEAIPSPLQIRGDKVMTDSGSIPGTIPGANTSILTVYTTSLPYECAVDGTTATPNRTWKTTLTDWISPEFGSTYQVKVWVNLASSAGNASTAGTSLSAGGSGNNDEWFFDYQAGTLHFIGTNLPNGVSFTGKSVYISGARYTGGFGVSAPGGGGSVGNLTISNVTISANTSAVSSSANIIFSTSGTGAVQFTGNNAIGLPIGNIANRPTTVNPGYLRFNTEYETIEVWDGTEWVQTSGGVITSDVLNGDGSTTQFALSANTTTTGVLVSINGTIQKPSTAYTVSNNTITFTEIPALGDAIEVRKLSGGTISVNYGNSDVAAFLSTYSGLYSNVQALTYLTSGVAGNIIPSANVTYSLGSPTRQWKDLFVSNTTIYLGGIPLSIDASGNLLVNGSQVQGSGGGANLVTYSGNISAGAITLSGPTGAVGNVKVLTPGSGFTMFMFYATSGGSGTGLSLVAQNSTIFDPVQFNSRGTGYRVGDIITIVNDITGPGYSNATVVVTELLGVVSPGIFVGNTAYKFGADGNIRLPAGGGILDSTGTSVLGGSGGTNYSNVNVSALITTNGLTNYSNVNTAAYTTAMGFQNFGNVNVAAYVTTSNSAVIGYVDNSVSTANIGVIGYIDRANTIQSAQITAANLGIKGYIDNSTSTANLGMKGYVDSQSFYSNAKVSTYLPTYSGNVSALNFVGAIQAQVGSSFAYSLNAFGAGQDSGGVFLPADTNSNAIVAGYTIVGNSGAVTLTVTSATFVAGTPNFVQVATTPTAASFTYPVTVYTANYSPALPLSTITVGNATVSGNVSAQYFVGNGALLTGISTGSNYGNTQVEVFANLSNYAWNANVTSANVGMKGYVDGANLAMKGYVDSVATLSSYSNVNVSALITTNGLTNYSNVNTAAYLATATINTTGNITAGTISASNIVLNGSTVSIGAINPAYMVVGLVSSITGFGLGSTVVLDTVVGNVNSQTSYNTSTGVFTLTAGVTYDLSFTPSFITFSNTLGGYLCYEWVDATANTPLDSTGTGIGTSIPTTESGGQIDNPTARVIYTPSTNQTVKLRVTSANGTATLRGAIGTQAVVRPLNSTFALQSNITFANIVSTGNITATNFIGNGALLTNLPTGSNYSNVQVATYLPTYSGVVTASNVAVAGNVTAQYLFGNGSQLTGIASSYSNVQTAAYLNATGYNLYSNVNLIAYLAGNISTGNITATGFIGNGAGLTNVTFSQAGNIVGTQTNVTLQAGTFTSVFNNQGNVILPNVYVNGGATVVGTVNSNGGTAGTAFAVRGSGAVSNVALGYFPPVGTPAEMAIRDYSTANSTMYFDNTIGSGNVGGTFQFRSTSSYTQWAKIDRFGITLPTRPAFRVNGTGLVGQTTGNVNLKGAAVTTIFNQGSYFDATTGQFTAPVAGIYSVGLVCRVNTNSLSSIGVFKNGVVSSSNTICYWEADASTGTATHFGVTGTVVLAAGDYLSANITNGTVTFDGNDNWHVTYIG